MESKEGSHFLGHLPMHTAKQVMGKNVLMRSGSEEQGEEAAEEKSFLKVVG